MMAISSNLIRSRLAWCRIQRMRAIAKEEADRFLAEEEGLLDAMHGTDRTELYSQNHRSIVTSYEIGLHDGQALMGLQRWIDTQEAISTNGGGRAMSFPENHHIGEKSSQSAPPPCRELQDELSAL